MEGKIGFGIDYFQTMLETAMRFKKNIHIAHELARNLLILEWGFNIEEQNEANRKFWELMDAKALDDLETAIMRLAKHFENKADATSRLLTDLLWIIYLEGDVCREDEEKDRIRFLRAIFDYFNLNYSELPKLLLRINDMLYVFDWFEKNKMILSRY